MKQRLRRAVPTILVVLASLVLFVAAFAVWVDRQALDTPTWTTTSTELLADPVVTDQLSVAIADRLDARIGFEEQAAEALPPRLQRFAPTLGASIHALVQQTAERVLESDRFQNIWEQVNARTHRDLVSVLRGHSALQTQNDTVVLDLRPLLAEVARQSGLPGTRIENLPANQATIEILPADKVETAQKITGWLDAAASWLGLLAILLYAAAIWFADDRRKQLFRAGIGAMIVALLLFVTRRLLAGYLPGAVAKTPQGEDIVRVTYKLVTEGLIITATTILAIGVVATLAAWLAGPRGNAVKVRRTIAPWIAEPWKAFGGLAVLILLVIAWGPTPAARNPLAIVVLGAALVLGLEVLRRQTARETAAPGGGDPTPAT